MIRLLTNVLHLAWALWFGGMVVLLIFVTQLFKKSHATGVDSAPVLFDTFAIYQLVVGAVACIAATALYVMNKRKLMSSITSLLLVAFGAAIELRNLTHRIDMLRLQGRTETELFKKLHGLSGAGYVLAAVCLFVSGLLFINLSRPPERARRIAREIDSPAAM